MRLVVALVLLVLVTGCGESSPEQPDQSGRSMPTTASRAVVGSTGGSLSFGTDWTAPFTGDLSGHHAVGCVRELVVLGADLEADLSVSGPDGADWECAAVVEGVSWAGAGPIGLSAYVSTRSAQRVRAAVLTDPSDPRARVDLLVMDWDDAQRAWFGKVRTPTPLTGTIATAGRDTVVSVAETPTRIAAKNDTQVFSVYMEIAPTSVRQAVTVATGVGKVLEKSFVGQ